MLGRDPATGLAEAVPATLRLMALLWPEQADAEDPQVFWCGILSGLAAAGFAYGSLRFGRHVYRRCKARRIAAEQKRLSLPLLGSVSPAAPVRERGLSTQSALEQLRDSQVYPEDPDDMWYDALEAEEDEGQNIVDAFRVFCEGDADGELSVMTPSNFVRAETPVVSSSLTGVTVKKFQAESTRRYRVTGASGMHQNVNGIYKFVENVDGVPKFRRSGPGECCVLFCKEGRWQINVKDDLTGCVLSAEQSSSNNLPPRRTPWRCTDNGPSMELELLLLQGGSVGQAWSPSPPGGVELRVGPNYLRNKAKAPSNPSLYDVVGVDLLAGDRRLDKVVPRMCQPPEKEPQGWEEGLGIPRYMVINCQIPRQEGPKLWGEHPEEDTGVSLILHAVPSPEVLRVARLLSQGLPPGEAPPPIANAVRMLKHIVAHGDVGRAGGSACSGTLKVIGWVENLAKIELPALLKPTVLKYNGKPVLLTDPVDYSVSRTGDWMELDLDLRKFAWISKSVLCKLQGRLKDEICQLAFTFQGTNDEELPEVALMSVRLHNMDSVAGAIAVQDTDFTDGVSVDGGDRPTISRAHTAPVRR